MTCRLGITLGLCGLLLVSAIASAVSTRQFVLDSESALSEGKLEGTAVESTGVVRPSVETHRHQLDDVGVAKSLLIDASGAAYVGSGNDGKIFRFAAGTVTELADTEELLISALVQDDRGVLFAGTLPHGKIFKVDKTGAVELFAQPKGAEHVWALVFDPTSKTLFAATGPEGKVFAIDRKGKSEVYYDAAAEHIMALARDQQGRLIAGTSDEALLLRLQGPGRAEVLYDFEGNEVTAIAISGGRIAVGANHFAKKKKAKSTAKKRSSSSNDKDKTSEKPASDTPPPGRGQVWEIAADGRARKLFTSEQGHITALEWGDDDEIYAATGKEGHIYRLRGDGSHALWIDVDERQVLGLSLTGKTPMFTTGDAGALYTVAPGRARKARWISKVLDARFRSRFGQLTWRGRGKLAFQTRSGHTEKPDDSWSDWSAVLTKPGPMRSPAARFLQIRADLDPSDDTAIYAVQAYYLPRNQPVSITSVEAEPKSNKSKSDESDEPTSVYALAWKVDNPDHDELRYRLYYRPEGGGGWRPILKESDVLTKTSYEWETEAIPDGFYRIRVEASDELDNPEHAVLRADARSEPFQLDNHSPHIDRLRFAAGRVSGVARDSLGPIAALEYAIDGQEWRPFYPKDDLFDTREEPFELTLPKLDEGVHVIAIRARDSLSNATTAEVEVEL